MAKLIWITGLSGSGKTTIGKEVFARLKKRHPNTVFLDGDSFRAILGNDLGHTPADRLLNARRISAMCAFLVGQDINVVCATMSLYGEIFEQNRKNVREYYEIFIECSLDELKRRDQKGLYSGFSSGANGGVKNVVGMDLAFDMPKNCHLKIDNTRQDALDLKAAQILKLIGEQ